MSEAIMNSPKLLCGEIPRQKRVSLKKELPASPCNWSAWPGSGMIKTIFRLLRWTPSKLISSTERSIDVSASPTWTSKAIQWSLIENEIESISSEVSEPIPKWKVAARVASIACDFPINRKYAWHCLEPALLPYAAHVPTTTLSNFSPNCCFGTVDVIVWTNAMFKNQLGRLLNCWYRPVL